MSSEEKPFDPMAPVDPPKQSEPSSRARTVFNIAVGIGAGVATKWATGNDYLAISVAPVASWAVSKTSLFKASAVFAKNLGSEPENDGPS